MPKVLFKSHYQLDGIERIGAQVVHKGGGGSDFAFIHTELLDDNLFSRVLRRWPF